jgi:hypothetical protein
MRVPPLSRLPFLAAVALIAAAIADPLVETIANTGVLGRGYADNDHSSVVPTLIIGAILTLLVTGGRTWTLALARHVAERSALDDLPYVVVVQLAALFIMESAEQVLVGGRYLGGTAWLGGPVWFSLCTHIIVGVTCALLIARGMRAIAHRAAPLVSIALELILCALGRGGGLLFAHRRHQTARCYAQHRNLRRLGERAPPLLLATLF